MHISLYADINYESAIYVYPMEKFNLSFNLNYLHTSYDRTVIDISDPYGYRRMGDFVFQDRCFGVTLTQGGGIWGIRAKYIEEKIDDEKASTVAADFGILIPGKITFGASLQNIGPEIRFIKQKEKLPQTLSAGLKFNLRWLSLFTSANFYPDRKHRQLLQWN